MKLPSDITDPHNLSPVVPACSFGEDEAGYVPAEKRDVSSIQ